MIKAVIFDMYETLITFYKSPVYFGKQIAADAQIPEDAFLKQWRATENDRTIGNLTLEETIEMILSEHKCYSDSLLNTIVQKRIATNEACFQNLHPEIIPMLSGLKEHGIKTGLISNCFSEEALVIRGSVLFPYFDAAILSYEQRVQKPDHEIYRRCMEQLSVQADECLYVGDGGSCELEAARELGMHAVQAVWYLQDGTMQPVGRKEGFMQVERPLDVVGMVSMAMQISFCKKTLVSPPTLSENDICPPPHNAQQQAPSP